MINMKLLFLGPETVINADSISKISIVTKYQDYNGKSEKVYSICACIRNGFEKIETIKIIEELWSFGSALAFMRNLTKACTNSYIKVIIINDESRFDPRWYLKCDKDNNYTYDKNNSITSTKRLFNYFVDDEDYKDGVILINAWNDSMHALSQGFPLWE